MIDAGGSPEVRRDALDRALADARERDALSLWHLLARLEPEGRGRVFDRLAQLVPPPEGVTRDGVVAGDRAMRDLWWDELGLGSSDFWRLWTRSTMAPRRAADRGGGAPLPPAEIHRRPWPGPRSA